MDNDKKRITLIKTIKSKAEEWIDCVETLGNQCATSDRIAETIAELGQQLKKLKVQ